MKRFASKLSGKYLAVALVAFFALTTFCISSHMAFAQTTLSFPSQTTTGAATTPSQSANTLSFPSQTSASASVTPPSDYDCSIVTNGFMTCAVYFIGYLVQQLVSLLITIGGALITFALQLGANVYASPMIQAGFGICLSIANLGFVLAIIVIAIATIFRSETYGYKKTLWRLIIMAVLVNFGLVITAPLVNLANGMSTYFLNSIQGGSGVNQLSGFVSSLAQTTSLGAIQQAPSMTQSQCQQNANLSSLAVGQAASQQALQGCANLPTTASPSGTFMQELESIFFGIIYSLVIALAFFSIGSLLFVRYIWLGVLLVVLPLAWLTWIFPKFSGEFSKWWSNFIKWSFFSPAALFFIWLALSIEKTGNNAYLNGVMQTQQAQNIANTPIGAFIAATGQTGTIFQFMDNIVVIGIMIGGLMAASSMTGKAGSFVVEQAKGVSGAVTGFVGRRAKDAKNFAGKQVKKGTRAAYQKVGGSELTTRLQEGRIGFLGSIPLGRRAASLAGRGISSIASNEKLVEEAKKKVPKNPEEIKKNLRGSMNKEDQLAHIAKLIEMNEYKGDEIINGTGVVLKEDKLGADGKVLKKKGEVDWVGQKASEFLDANQDNGLIERYGQGKLVKDADKAVISNKAMRDAEKALNALAPAARAGSAAMKTLDEATRQFMEKLNKGDISKANINGIVGQDTELSKAITRGFMLTSPELIPSALVKMNKSTIKKFNGQYKEVYEDEMDKIYGDLTLTSAQKAARIEDLKDKMDKFNKALGKNALDVAPETPTTTPTPTPTPTPPPTGGH